MGIKIFHVILLIIIINTSPNFLAQNTPSISLISSSIFFINTEVTKSNSRHIPGSKYALPAVTYYEQDHYSLKLSININSYSNDSETPLDVRVTSESGQKKVIRIKNDISGIELGMHHYEFDIVLNETGWYAIEIGDYSTSDGKENLEVTYDKSSVYVNK